MLLEILQYEQNNTDDENDEVSVLFAIVVTIFLAHNTITIKLVTKFNSSTNC